MNTGSGPPPGDELEKWLAGAEEKERDYFREWFEKSDIDHSLHESEVDLMREAWNAAVKRMLWIYDHQSTGGPNIFGDYLIRRDDIAKLIRRIA